MVSAVASPSYVSYLPSPPHEPLDHHSLAEMQKIQLRAVPRSSAYRSHLEKLLEALAILFELLSPTSTTSAVGVASVY